MDIILLAVCQHLLILQCPHCHYFEIGSVVFQKEVYHTHLASLYLDTVLHLKQKSDATTEEVESARCAHDWRRCDVVVI